MLYHKMIQVFEFLRHNFYAILFHFHHDLFMV